MKSVLTIATGKKIYIDMACNLALSFLLWNKNNGIEFYLVTDNASLIPEKIKERIKIIEIDTNDYDTGFAIKLYLDKFIQTDQTLFIDCDCLVYGDLISVFDKFEGKSVSSIGNNKLEGDFFGDILSIRTQYQLVYLPKFVGAIYYIKKGELTKTIFDYARKIKPDYDKIGLIRLNGKVNEEPLLAIAMAKFNQSPVEDFGVIKADKMYFSHLSSNVLKPFAHLWNVLSLPQPSSSNIWSSKPLIVHFNASFSDTYEYFSEKMRLHYKYKSKMPNVLINFIIWISIIFPNQLKIGFIKAVRPFYHLVFGIRKVKKTIR